MAYKKGESGNPLGKPKGITNKSTKEFRQFVENILNENLDKIQKDFESLESRERIILFEKLLQYVIPKKREEEIIDNKRDEIIDRLFN